MKPAVLFIDDFTLARATIAHRLREIGLSVTAVGSSREVEEIDIAGLSAALLDIELGDGLGTEVARRLREHAPRLPVVFLSSHESDSGPSLREEAQRLGPVFSKLSDADAAVRWIAERATCAG